MGKLSEDGCSGDIKLSEYVLSVLWGGLYLITILGSFYFYISCKQVLISTFPRFFLIHLGI